MTKKISALLFSFFLLCFLRNNAQDNSNYKNELTEKIEQYFKLERENIHLHCNKSIYMTDEAIWFKGYVYHRKIGLPFFATTNVYAILYDSEGKKVDEKLLFALAGSFNGCFKLNDKLNSGRYYIQVYTNWMNNFSENESTTFPIDIINTLQGPSIMNLPDYNNINVSFQPEGGNYIEDITNVMGIKIADCNDLPLEISKAEIKNSKGIVISNIILSKSGFGRFEITPNQSETYKAVITVANITKEYPLPMPEKSGIGLEVNNYGSGNKTIVKIKTNKLTQNILDRKPLYVLVHQDDKVTIFDFQIDNTKKEQLLVFSNDDLTDGTNTIRVIDNNFKQIAERLIFKYPTTTSDISIQQKKKKNDLFWISTIINAPEASLSISVLPAKSTALNTQQCIQGTLLLNSYLSDPLSNTKYYFTDISRIKQFEVDLALLNQKKSKYEWNTILSTPPKDNYEFDLGLKLKGTINQKLTDKSKYKIRMYSFVSGINQMAEINDKNEFYFDYLILGDSTWVNFTLFKDNNTPVSLNLYPQITNNKRKYRIPFIPRTICNNITTTTEYEIPHFSKGAILLDDVGITVDNKKRLKHESKAGNANLRSFKISDNEKNNYFDVLGFIRNNGFDVPHNTGADVAIYSRTRNSINGGQSGPVVFIDDMQQMTYDVLASMRMDEIDEIYLNPHAIVPSVRNFMGIIKIYRKSGGSMSNSKSNSKPFTIEGGFEKQENFKLPLYSSTNDAGFQNLGVINWITTVTNNEKGEFNFDTPVLNQKSVMLLIEGFTADGILISETKTIDTE